MKFNQAQKYLNPLPQFIEIKQWGGGIVVGGLTIGEVEELENKDKWKFFEKQIIKPILTLEDIKTFQTKGFSQIDFIFEVMMLKNGLHPKTDLFIRGMFDNNLLYWKFRLAKDQQINVWSDKNSINTMYNLEFLFWMEFLRMNRGK